MSPPASVSQLIIAAHTGNVGAAQAALQAGAPVDELGPEGHTALEIAAHRGHAELARLLLQYGAHPSRPTRPPGATSALALATFRGDLAMVDLLLEAGADPADVCRGNVASLLRVRGDILRLLVAAGGSVPAEIEGLLAGGKALGDE